MLRTATEAGLDRFHSVGHSLGGLIALATATPPPDPVASVAQIEPAPVRSLEITPEGDAVWLDPASATTSLQPNVQGWRVSGPPPRSMANPDSPLPGPLANNIRLSR